MGMVDLIDKKRRGDALTAEEISFLIQGYTAGGIPDYQMAAFLMAVCLRGMTVEETVHLTRCMTESGDRVDLSALGTLSVDKHSTGGVGDKTTLIVTPIVAAAGAKVAKMSGRALGHTGGTIDKLEAIPGYRTQMTPDRFMEQVETVGCAVVGQSGNLAPADKKIYALRDVTATVESIPLIAASIMSKKLAAGARNIVLDVKVGSGAFMKTRQQAEALARTMMAIGAGNGRRVTAVLTGMDVPLGCKIGNALEVREALSLLQGKGDSALREVCLCLAAEMLCLALSCPLQQARALAEEKLNNGSALAVFYRWIRAQGGDLEALPTASYTQTVYAQQAGYIQRIDAITVGKAAGLLGAGRTVKEDAVDPAAGIELLVRQGDCCRAGQPLAVLHAGNNGRFAGAHALLGQAFTMGSQPPTPASPVVTVLRG